MRNSERDAKNTLSYIERGGQQREVGGGQSKRKREGQERGRGMGSFPTSGFYCFKADT